ncbi:Proteophosphoglycan 5 [Rhodotorula toruloides ATCC 204091]|uniref:BY PROTMAP: gi/342320720/gb/EGU12659.1/ Proteophosphoglycan 5 [Rhodotorula glutinis ATCC 204091] n=1 Tax=Rhodotorula toruloides TaxID=5286 RepID=A0A0K3C798_RHOTO|nr:Proteophosphoglycan 5 [Rhodotorula toruloides ATCC 204091]KAK4331510.1 Proteophosphoglycan 5 [Rhodotorula toruloides]
MLALEERANDGFWTPGMGEAGFSATASAESAQITPVINPKAVSAELPPTVILTTIIKIVAPVTVTQLVEPAQATQAIDAATNVFDGTAATPVKVVQATVAPINPKATIASTPAVSPPRVFGGASSSGLIRVLGATAASSAFGGNEALTTLQPTPPTSTPAIATSSSERILQPFTQSQIRVAAAATAASFQPEQQSYAPALVTPPPTMTTSSAKVFAGTSSASHVAAAILPTISTSATPLANSATTPAADANGSIPSAASNGVGQESVSAMASLGTAAASSSETTAPGAPHLRSASGTLIAGSVLSGPSTYSARPDGSDFSSAYHTSALPSLTSKSAKPSSSLPASSLRNFTASPGGIAAITVGSLVGFAVLATLAIYLVCCCRRRRRQARRGLVELGSDTGSPGEEGQEWPPRPPSSASRDGVREMRELWRQSIGSEASTGLAGPAPLSESAVSPTLDERPVSSSDWTSFAGGHPWTDTGDSAVFSDAERRDSESTIGTAILNWNSRFAAGFPTSALSYPSTAAGNARAPHPLRTTARASTSSPSLYSGTATPALVTSPRSTFLPLSPRAQTTAYLASNARAPAVTRTSASIGSASQPRTKPSWMDSLDRVMGSAADLMAATLLSTVTPAGSRRGSAAARSFRGLRRAFGGPKEDDEEKGGKRALRNDEKEFDEKQDYFTAYPGPLAPVSPRVRHEEVGRAVSPTSPLMAYSAARGAMGLLAPPRPVHYRAPSSSSFYGPTPPTPRLQPRASPRLVPLPSSPEESTSPFDDYYAAETPASAATAFTALVEQQGRTARELRRPGQASTPLHIPPSPAVPPRTPTPTLGVDHPLLTQLNPSPRPFTRLQQVDRDEADPFADPSPFATPSPVVWVDKQSLAPAASVAVRQTETVETGPSRDDVEADNEPDIPSLRRHSAFAQLYLQRRLEGRQARRASTPNLRERFERDARKRPSSMASSFVVDAQVAEMACERLGEGGEDEGNPEDEEDGISSLDFSSSTTESSCEAGRAGTPLETDEERASRRMREAIEREKAALLMLERRRRSLADSLTSRRGSLAGSVGDSVA